MNISSWVVRACVYSAWLCLTCAAESAKARDFVIYDSGKAGRAMSPEEAAASGLVVVDLGADFVPPILRDIPELGEAGKPPYASIYRALADERFDEIPDQSRAIDERYLELYGIFPTLSVVQKRLLDDERHKCHAAIDNAPLASHTKKLWQLPPITEDTKPSLKTLAKRAAHAEAVKIVQAHLRCDGLLSTRAKDGTYDMWTAEAVRLYQRRHMIISWGIVDELTRATFLTESHELDFRSLLRSLRERVVAATGILEDGSAAGAESTVLGRTLDPPELQYVHSYGALKNGAPDLVSPATEVAARALGWTSPEEAVRWLREHQDMKTLGVALPLPSPPAYHTKNMALRVEIDRGEVWYGFPYEEDGTPKKQPVKRRPTLTLFAKDGDREVALVRWSTTIGGWQPENLPDGTVGLRYKNSDVGPRVWRQVIATPAWLPPESTPDKDLVRKINGRPMMNREIVGPGFASAYGLAMMPLETVWVPPRGGETTYGDRGIRTHGSVSYRSMLRGYSHGCHRLFNHLAIRMASFLVSHRERTANGNLPVSYSRNVTVDGVTRNITLLTRGFGYELTQPVPVEVLEGNIKGWPKHPIEAAMPLPVGYEEQ